MNPRNFFGELKRRHVYRVAIAYGVVAWLLIQVATQVFPFFEIPNWMIRLVVVAIALVGALAGGGHGVGVGAIDEGGDDNATAGFGEASGELADSTDQRIRTCHRRDSSALMVQ